MSTERVKSIEVGCKGEDILTNSLRKIADNTILQEIKENSDIKSVTIVSPSKSCPTDRIAEQLAAEFANQGCKILVLNLPGIKCSGSYIIDPAKAGKLIEECIEKTDNKNIDHLSLDEVGRSCGFTLNKASLLALLSQMKLKYRRILIDTISLEDDMSGFIAACAADGTYFTVSDDTLRSKNTERAYRELKQAGAKILGVIYSNVEARNMRRIQIKSR